MDHNNFSSSVRGTVHIIRYFVPVQFQVGSGDFLCMRNKM